MTAAENSADDRWFFGHPKGLLYLAFTEAWERFSYYGMVALLTLYMTKQLLLPGHMEHIAGIDLARRFFDETYGGGRTLTVVALASAIWAFYSSTVYLTPLLGGFLADRLLGRTRTVVLGACLMALGHFLMAFEVTFFLALICLVLGAGCLKGNLAAQVGGLYGPKDTRRADAFQIYLIAINTGVIFGPMVTGALGQGIAWHYGFGVAGIGMLLSLAIYLSGRRRLPPDPPLGAKARAAAAAERAPTTSREWRIVVLLVLLLPVLALSVVGNNQIQNVYPVWADNNADLSVLGFRFLSSQLLSVDSFVSVVTMGLMVWFWRVWSRRLPEPDELGKIIIGCIFSAIGVACLALGQSLAMTAGHKVAFSWLLLFHVLNDIGFANVFPVGLALYTRVAPRSMAGFMVAVYYLHLWLGNNLVGILGGRLDKMDGATFWMMHAILVGVAGVGFLVVKLLVGHWLRGEATEPDIATLVAADAGEMP
ncbi:MAG TPA: peptide MFS transporter [Phenylobacterium sp.]|jgi:POT family proton-dependent oligopeptide transporter|uniref:peptide MFS transporter n=1 Tax=Phenylobacterium sp. TaxID=1871053 RepID=UPI002D627023|nr:peptide MFS transporter [Phenylobacterium sp.]HZZ70258.1 peptide MFS transporter [Phenylobacterium sp.]